MHISHELPVENRCQSPILSLFQRSLLLLMELIKYDFSNINELVKKPPKKSIWKSLIMKAVERYWAKKIREIATCYPSLERLNSEGACKTLHLSRK
jgi:hypothetical protein